MLSINKSSGVSLVFPCLNEEKTLITIIPEAHKILLSISHEYEIIIADNSSTDNSVNIAKELGAKVINVKRRGYGSTLHSGILAAKYEHVIFADSDCSYPVKEVPKLIEPLRLQKADFVLGSRLDGKIDKGAMPYLNRHLGTPFLSFLIRTLLRLPVSDCNSGMRAFNRNIYKSLDMKCPGMEYASEMLIKIAKNNIKYIEVPIHFQKDQRDRKPHLKRWRDGWRHLRFIIGHSPSKYVILLPALIGFGCIAIALLISLNNYLKIFKYNHFHTAFSLVSLSIPFILISFSCTLINFTLQKRAKNKSKFYFFLKKMGENSVPFYVSMMFFFFSFIDILRASIIWYINNFGAFFEINSLIRATIFTTIGAIIFCSDLIIGLMNLLPDDDLEE
jgi:glycosyltransferase involved in cell wall biosynthesis